jgi:hypothetical protein
MSCKTYRDALIEAAGSGTEPEAELRAHLGSCADCRATFEQERLLFSAIDAGLQRVANAEVPASLLPGVRAGLDGVPAGRNVWNIRWVTLAAAAVIVAGVFVVRPAWHKDVVRSPVEVGRTAPAPQVTPPATENQKVATQVASNPDSPGSQARMHSARTLPVKASARRNSTPEVLVPKDQEVLLAEYAEEWRRRKGTVVLAKTFDPTVFSPLQVAPIQIDELGVKLLAEGNSQ